MSQQKLTMEQAIKILQTKGEYPSQMVLAKTQDKRQNYLLEKAGIKQLLQGIAKKMQAIEKRQNQVLNQTKPVKLEIPKKKLNLESVVQCIIQLSYTMYVAKWFKIRLNTKPLIVFDSRQCKLNQPLNMYIKYDIQQINSKQIQYTKFLYLNLAIITKHYQTKDFQIDAKDPMIPILTNFYNQLTRLDILNRQSNKERDQLLCLEETELFRKHSMLLKVKNCSILNIIKSDNKKLEQLKIFKKQQFELINEYKKARDQKLSASNLRKIEGKIEENVRKFFRQKLIKQVRYIPLEAAQQDPYKLKFMLKYFDRNAVIMKAESQQNLPKETVEKQDKEMKESLQKLSNFEGEIKNIISNLGPPPNTPPKIIIPISPNQFYVQYSSERNSICVKYITEIQLTVESSDVLMFQSNNLSYDASNVTIEIFERPIYNPSKFRYLTFKSTCCFLSKEPVLQKMLLMIDAAMVTAKGLESETVKIVVSQKDYLRPFELHKKINHYIAIMNVVGDIVYRIEGENQDNYLS